MPRMTRSKVRSADSETLTAHQQDDTQSKTQSKYFTKQSKTSKAKGLLLNYVGKFYWDKSYSMLQCVMSV